MKIILSIFLLALSVAGFCQPPEKRIIGRYEGFFSEPTLTLYTDSSFEFYSSDHVYPFRSEMYQSKGVWSSSGKVITLNPGMEKRNAKVTFNEKEIEGEDSIVVKVNYYIEEYDNEVLVKKESFHVRRIALFYNKKYSNLVHEPIRRICLYAPNVKNQLVMDSLNTVKLPKQKIQKLAFNTYGFVGKVELPLKNPRANYYEITIVQPVDTDRRPRGEQLVKEGKRIYGVYNDSLLPEDGLKKVK